MVVDRQTLAMLRAQKALLGRLTDEQVRDLAVAWARAWDEISTELDQATQTIAALDRPTRGQISRIGQVRQALRIASERLELVAAAGGLRLSAGLQQAIRLGQANTLDLTRSQLPNGLRIGLNRVDVRQLDAIVQRVTEQITARHVRISAEATAAMRRELLVSTAVGRNPRAAARNMLQRVEGAFDGGLTRAAVIARTEMLDAYRAGALESRKANPAVITGWVWITTLSSRTCRSCIAMHGTEHPADEPGPDDHHQGRCTSAPLTPSWRDLGIDLDEPKSAVPDADRWFRGLPEAEQRHILTDRGYDAWASGRYPRDAWTTKRETPGWRDAQVPSIPPAAGGQGGSGGSGRPPAPAATPGGPDWHRRQAALGIETHGERLEPHEIEFVERFQRLGHRLEWVPKDPQRRPSHDFIWLDNGDLPVELKSTKARYETIHGRIVDAASRAAKQGVVKENFIVDVGNEPLSGDLRASLAQFNVGRRKYRLAGLWVMSRGQLTRIPLQE